MSLDEIGAAAGIAGPSIYHHDATKPALLVGAFDRVLALLPASGCSLDGAIEQYVGLAVRSRTLDAGLHGVEGA